MTTTNTKYSLAMTVAACIVACTQFVPSHAQSTGTNSSKSVSLSGNKLLLKAGVRTFGVLTEDLQGDLGFECIRTGPNQARVERVRPGSEAYYQGLQAGDTIIAARASGNNFSLDIERNSKRYTVPLTRLVQGGTDPLAAAMQDKGQKIKEDANKPGAVGTKLTSEQLKMKLLSKYDIELFIDRSGSMSETDCPGRISRFQWCSNQAQDLIDSLTPYVKTGLTIVTFSDNHDVYEQTTTKQLLYIFSHERPDGGTNLVSPLQERLNAFFSRRKKGTKPLIVAIITDGLPNEPSPDPAVVRNVLVDATKKIGSAAELNITFLQIGDFAGQAYLQDLDENLMDKYGATFNIVHTRTFDQLKDSGVPEVLVDTILERPAFRTDRSAKPISPMESSLRAAQDERLQLEEELLRTRSGGK